MGEWPPPKKLVNVGDFGDTPSTDMPADAQDRRSLTQTEGERVWTAASRKGMNRGEFAQRVAGDGSRTDPSRHLRDVLKGDEPLTEPYAQRIATALEVSRDDLERIIRGTLDVESTKYPSFSIVRAIEAPAAWKADRFYNGCRPLWEDLAAGFDIARIPYSGKDGIQKRMDALVKEPCGLKALAIVGAGGTGKTTLLRRAGYDVAKSGRLVLELKSEWWRLGHSLVDQLRLACETATAPIVVLIDDVSDHLTSEAKLDGVLREIESLPVVLVLAEHPDRWHGALRRCQVLSRDVNCWVHPVYRLLPKECTTLIDRILSYEKDGTLSEIFCTLPRDERLKLALEFADRHLVVVMLQLRHGLPFQKIIENEFERIPMSKAKAGYALVCYLETLRLFLPESLLIRFLDLAGALEVQEFFEATEGLFEGNPAGRCSRNRVIARTVARHALPQPAARKAALLAVFSRIDLGDEDEQRLFLKAFSGENIHRRYVQDLRYDAAMVRQFYREIGAFISRNQNGYFKFVLTSQALSERLLHAPDAARQCLEHAIQLDPRYEFAHRQLAWLEFSQGQWERGAEFAIKAATLEPGNFRAIYDCAKILTLNLERFFPVARQYWQRALELDPESTKLRKEWELYEGYESQRKYLRDLRDDELISERVWRGLRPGLNLDKLRFGAGDARVVKELKSNLVRMSGDMQGSREELEQKTEGFDLERSPEIKGLYLANVARVEFLSWRRNDDGLSPDELQKLFEDGIELNPGDPFAHSWHGTFLKEARGDFAGAKREYEHALQIGNKSSDPRLKSHPLFLNNLALLIIDEVQQKTRQPEELREALSLLERAIARVPETKPDFFWPEFNHALCRALMEELGVSQQATSIKKR